MSTYELMAAHLETERLTLRPWADTDAEELRALFAERGEGTPTAEEARRDIEVLREREAAAGISLLPIVRRQEGDVIGYCGLVVGRSTVEEPEIAYELFRRVHGHGYATEAARAVIAAAAATGRTRLWATTRPANEPSLRVLEKTGFTHHRTTRDDRGDVVWLTRSLTGDAG